MKIDPKLNDPSGLPEPGSASALSLMKEGKGRGSHRSMWENLLELRVLLPYLSHLAPLLERPAKGASGLSELSRGIELIQTGSRELETLARNQTLQLERVEEQVVHLQEAHQHVLTESRAFFTEMRAFQRWMIRITVTTAILVGASAGLIVYLLLRT